ncbi:GNAT family N-acetyltransferase [Ectopseudomonas chengduensis]|nr:MULTISPECIES: GNAT family N-acetyltransferase [Pseudomonas]MBP3061996.1 N-acetyltransferase [Pseudomonas chengduensis]NNB75290.1 GNAT family N-acetyltransferase [Pseudomonas chengduensis]OEO24470.1 GNAT family N-acetyltransferase [Pseudomonas sp. J237]
MSKSIRIADPMEALVSLQREIRRGMQTHPTEMSPSVRVIHDQPTGIARYTYAKIEHGRVKAISIFVHHEPIDGIPCFNLGYAVPEAYCNRGWAKEIVEQGIQELRLGLGRHGVKSFYVEAVVGKDNLASQRVASKVISDTPVEGTDSESGEAILAYTRLVEC